MEVTVTKSTGATQPLDMAKIEKAVEKAGKEIDKAAEAIGNAVRAATSAVTKELGSRTDVTSKEIRTWVLQTLDEVDKEIADSWRAFDERMGKA